MKSADTVFYSGRKAGKRRGSGGKEFRILAQPLLESLLWRTAPHIVIPESPATAGRDSDYVAADRGADARKFFPISAQGLWRKHPVSWSFTIPVACMWA